MPTFTPALPKETIEEITTCEITLETFSEPVFVHGTGKTIEKSIIQRSINNDQAANKEITWTGIPISGFYEENKDVLDTLSEKENQSTSSRLASGFHALVLGASANSPSQIERVVPKNLIYCPLTGKIFLKPVFLHGSGRTIEEAKAQELIQEAKLVGQPVMDPWTNEPIEGTYESNLIVQGAVDRYLAKNIEEKKNQYGYQYEDPELAFERQKLEDSLLASELAGSASPVPRFGIIDESKSERLKPKPGLFTSRRPELRQPREPIPFPRYIAIASGLPLNDVTKIAAHGPCSPYVRAIIGAATACNYEQGDVSPALTIENTHYKFRYCMYNTMRLEDYLSWFDIAMFQDSAFQFCFHLDPMAVMNWSIGIEYHSLAPSVTFLQIEYGPNNEIHFSPIGDGELREIKQVEDPAEASSIIKNLFIQALQLSQNPEDLAAIAEGRQAVSRSSALTA